MFVLQRQRRPDELNSGANDFVEYKRARRQFGGNRRIARQRERGSEGNFKRGGVFDPAIHLPFSNTEARVDSVKCTQDALLSIGQLQRVIFFKLCFRVKI